MSSLFFLFFFYCSLFLLAFHVRMRGTHLHPTRKRAFDREDFKWIFVQRQTDKQAPPSFSFSSVFFFFFSFCKSLFISLVFSDYLLFISFFPLIFFIFLVFFFYLKNLRGKRFNQGIQKAIISLSLSSIFVLNFIFSLVLIFFFLTSIIVFYVFALYFKGIFLILFFLI